MRTFCIAQGTLLNVLWWPKWEGNPKKRGYLCIYNDCPKKCNTKGCSKYPTIALISHASKSYAQNPSS